LSKVIDALEKWAEENEIEVNKKKSGILIIDNDRHDMHEFRGYPIKVTYKYLGLTLNNALSPRTGLEAMKKKLDVYISRSGWINKKFFTPKTLLSLAGYYQHSRIVYGMSCFLDMKDIIESVQKGAMIYTKAILGLSNQVNSNRLRLVLNKPLESHMLWVLLRKTMNKYRLHFGEEAWIYNQVDNQYGNWLSSLTRSDEKVNRRITALALEKTGYSNFKKYIGANSIATFAALDGIRIGKSYRELHRKKYFMAYDRRDAYLIRFLVDFGFYKGRFVPLCRYCGNENSRTHVTNSCEGFKSLRKNTWKKLGKYLKKEDYGDDLERAILDAYYDPGDKCQDVLEVIKSFAIQLVIKSCELDKTL
jgi:hypothetical protein